MKLYIFRFLPPAFYPLLLISCFLLLTSSSVYAINWTVMVYMCGDNSMNEQTYEDIEEMLEVGSTEKVKVIVQVDNLSSSIEPNCRRYLIKQGQKELLENLGEIDMADPQTLIEFCRFSKINYSAENYVLILWDHGNGWPIGDYNATGEKGIIYDQSSNNWIGIADGELKTAVTEIKKIFNKNISIIGFDACLMAMAEVAGELTNSADIMVASEEITPWDGLPYNDILSYSISHPNISASDLTKKMVEITTNSYNNGSQHYAPCTFSAVDLKQFSRAQKDFINTANIIACYANTSSVRQARNLVQTFSIESSQNPAPTARDDYIDLIDFLEKSKNCADDQNEKQQIERTISYFKQAVLAHKNVGTYLDSAKGISIWFPDNYIAFKKQYNDYRGLNWSNTISWLSLLNNYYNSDDVKPSQPIISDIHVNKKNDFYLFWNKSYDLASVRYDILETKNITQLFSDDCETMQSWTSDGFSVSSDQYFSQSKSFYSGNGNNYNNILELNQPFSVIDGGILSFWTYYSTEEKHLLTGQTKKDVFYVEISVIDNGFKKLDSFYGTQKTWTEHRYLLPRTDYLQVRFRYKTDESYSDLGVYIDDIRISKFDNIRQIASNYPDTFYYFYNLPQGKYYYLVSSIDSFGNKGFTSDEKILTINNYCEPFSLPSPFFRDCNIYCDFPSQENCDLYIYTLSGELVRKIDNNDIQNKIVYWDGTNSRGNMVASGIYIVLLKSDNFTKIGKIAKVK